MHAQMTNLSFGQAIEAMKKGYKVAVPEWSGFWLVDKGRIMAHCADGSVVEATHFQVNVFRTDWMIVEYR